MTNIFQQHGAFSWFELMTTDSSAAKEFYARLLGWEMADQQMEAGDYTVVKVGGEQVGGLMKMPPEMQGIPSYWGVYVTVEDVDAAAKLVEELGGQVKVPPMNIPDVGRFSVIQDPQGAVLSIITYTPNPNLG